MSAVIEIDDDVPLPAGGVGSGVGPAFVYPWAKLRVGQSFFVPRRMKNPRSALVKGQVATGFVFEYRRLVEDVPTGEVTEISEDVELPDGTFETRTATVPVTKPTEGVRFWRMR